MSLSKPLIYFPQTDFENVIHSAKSPFSGKLRVEAMDDESVFHVSFPESHFGSPARAAYLRVDELPKADEVEIAVKHLLVTASSQENRIAVFVASTETTPSLAAYLLKAPSDTVIAADIMSLPSSSLFHSRSIIETSYLRNKSVCVIGLGSGGSHVAVELVKAGVGGLLLIDFDRLEVSNIARHACTTKDIGRLKTNAMKDLLRTTNPEVHVDTCNADINTALYREEDLRSAIKSCDLIVGATDTLQSRRNINVLSLQTGLVTILGKCSVRAAGGDVLVVRPGEGPCLTCVYDTVTPTEDEASDFRRVRGSSPAYVPDSVVEATIQVGLSSDIVPVANMIVKIALVELSKGTDSGLKTLEADLKGDLYRWANRRDQEFSSYPEGGFQQYNVPSILRWYSVDFPRNPDCSDCRETNVPSSGFFGSP
eukprot:m.220417 g.220417  ORF g.220417 m.220417 type:complete len:425 (+) comp39939_c0_seq5:2484-3758(+)